MSHVDQRLFGSHGSRESATCWSAESHKLRAGPLPAALVIATKAAFLVLRFRHKRLQPRCKGFILVGKILDQNGEKSVDSLFSPTGQACILEFYENDFAILPVLFLV